MPNWGNPNLWEQLSGNPYNPSVWGTRATAFKAYSPEAREERDPDNRITEVDQYDEQGSSGQLSARSRAASQTGSGLQEDTREIVTDSMPPPTSTQPLRDSHRPSSSSTRRVQSPTSSIASSRSFSISQARTILRQRRSVNQRREPLQAHSDRDSIWTRHTEAGNVESQSRASTVIRSASQGSTQPERIRESIEWHPEGTETPPYGSDDRNQAGQRDRTGLDSRWSTPTATLPPGDRDVIYPPRVRYSSTLSGVLEEHVDAITPGPNRRSYTDGNLASREMGPEYWREVNRAEQELIAERDCGEPGPASSRRTHRRRASATTAAHPLVPTRN